MTDDTCHLDTVWPIGVRLVFWGCVLCILSVRLGSNNGSGNTQNIDGYERDLLWASKGICGALNIIVYEVKRTLKGKYKMAPM